MSEVHQAGQMPFILLVTFSVLNTILNGLNWFWCVHSRYATLQWTFKLMGGKLRRFSKMIAMLRKRVGKTPVEDAKKAS